MYQIPCKQCPKSYIGQTGRQLGERVKEHRSTAPSRIPSAVAEHSINYNHKIDWEGIKVLDKDNRDFPRLVKEAIQIRKSDSTMNRDVGLDLPAIYNSALIHPHRDASPGRQQYAPRAHDATHHHRAHPSNTTHYL